MECQLMVSVFHVDLSEKRARCALTHKATLYGRHNITYITIRLEFAYIC